MDIHKKESITKSLKLRKYDHVFSLGEACFCTTILIKAGLRNSSGPFDWCFGSDLTTRINIMTSNFKGFIDKEFLEKIGERQHP